MLSLFKFNLSKVTSIRKGKIIALVCINLSVPAVYTNSAPGYSYGEYDGIPDSLSGRKKVYTLDTIRYDQRMIQLLNGKAPGMWPIKGPRYPLAGALLPFYRVVAYYGNFYAKGMGILGEIPPDEMLQRLNMEKKKWERADPLTPVMPALHYVAVTAQDNPGKDGKYRLRMPANEMSKTVEFSRKIKGITFLDIQIGLGSLEQELIYLDSFLRQPDVHLGIDPEYSMKGGQVPCTVIGSFDASDINLASNYLADLVRKYKLPPKILVVHRFTTDMVTNYKNIIIRPEVQIVMNMDGFGFPAKKIDSYKGAIVREPVQFTGFKLFYRYDLSKGYSSIMQPEEILKLSPRPIYIQYQ